MILTNIIISKKTLSSILLCLLLLFGLNYLRANDIRSNHQSKIREFDVETGVVFSGYNDVQIPKATGTRISLSQQLTIDPGFFIRARFNYTINNRHTLSAFIAPLTLKASGSLNFPVRFQDTLFPANIPLNAVYRFNSYRLTYRYNFFPKEKLILGLGFTAKIRDAEISLESGNLKSKKTNIGFVPLINFQAQVLLTERLNLILAGDALAAPQGRAEDIFIGGSYRFSDKFNLKLGYRFLEGGADVDEVYNFAWLNYGVIGFMLKI